MYKCNVYATLDNTVTKSRDFYTHFIFRVQRKKNKLLVLPRRASSSRENIFFTEKKHSDFPMVYLKTRGIRPVIVRSNIFVYTPNGYSKRI